MEMSRRLIASNLDLREALVAFHESSEAADARLESLTRWLVRLTVALVVLTLAVIGLTALLIAEA